MQFIDLHCDTILHCHDTGCGLAENDGQIDVQKLRAGHALAQFIAVFIAPGPDGKPNPEPYQFFRGVREKTYLPELRKNPELAPAFCCDDILRNEAAGKISTILTIEDSAPLEGKLERVEEFHTLGVRLMTLTWNFENELGYPNSRDPELAARGLKPFGIEAVQRMQELGILVDVSHLNEGGFWDVVKYAKKPFVASHSCARALCDHPRDLTDDQLRALAKNGGMVGLNFLPSFLTENAEETTIARLVEHFRYIADVAGVDSVGFGSDFDGIGEAKLEFRDYSGMPRIADALEMQFTSSEVEKICRGNALRVIKESMK